MKSTSKGESGARRWTRPASPVFDFALACQAIPLIRRIASDIVAARRGLIQRRDELTKLVSQQSPTGSRARFALEDQVRQLRAHLRILIDELHSVGVSLLDPVRGEVGFPTIVNGSLAYLVYRLSDDAICFWRYRDQRRLRPLPTHWKSASLVQDEVEEEGLLI